MTAKKLKRSSTLKPTIGSKKTAQRNDRPPDPDGYFAKLARRARKVLAFYEPLGGFGREEVVRFLILDLMHLRDREPELGDVFESYVWAENMYDRLVQQSREMAETPDFP